MDATRVVAPAAVGTLIDALRERGFRVVGPRVRDGAIVYDEVEGLADLPQGWTDVQRAGGYELQRRDDEALFAYAVGPDGPKRQLFPPRQELWSALREGDTRFRVVEAPRDAVATAILGVRACELAAIAIQDRVFLRGLVRDTVYAARREQLALVAVNCTTPGGTCFCASMGTGPRAGEGADIVLTELLDGGRHAILVEPRTGLGEELAAAMGGRPATPEDERRAGSALAAAEEAMGRALDTEGLHDRLLAGLGHPHWDDVGERCLTCGNCTLVCPTCFCTQVEDVTDLAGERATRERRWDSCFTVGFSQVGPASVRTSASSRYRQWATHKLATWIDQFDTSGCVGCGRCITWCPVGIDLTEEVAIVAGTCTEVPT